MTDVFSWGDSDPFEEDDSWMSEPESVCNNWRGWKKAPSTSTGAGGGTAGAGPSGLSAYARAEAARDTSSSAAIAYSAALNGGAIPVAASSLATAGGSSSLSTAAGNLGTGAGLGATLSAAGAATAAGGLGSLAALHHHRPSSPTFQILTSTLRDGSNVLSLTELAARIVASYIPFEVVQRFSTPVPEQLQLRIAFWSFPDNEEDIRLYSCLANGSADEFQKGETLYRGRAVQSLLQIGFHLSATVVSPAIKACTVAVAFDRGRITSCSCTCNCSSSWCSHVVAVCLHRIYQPTAVSLRAPVTESLSRLDQTQLQKFAQYLINEFPQQILPTAQRLLDDLLNPDSSINQVWGAPDPTAGALIHDQTKWCLDENQLHDNIRKIVIKLCIPSPMVYSDVNYLSSTAPPAASEWTSLLRPLRGREPEGLWNLLSIVREMLRRHDRNYIPLLKILTEEILTCETILLWWFNTNVSLHRGYPPSSYGSGNGSGGGGNNNRSSIHSNIHASQHACSSLCDEIVVLWRLVTLNPALPPQDTRFLYEQLQEYHLQTLAMVVNANPRSRHQQNSSSATYGSVKSTDIEVFSGFKPAMVGCLIDWKSYPISGVTNAHKNPYCPSINAASSSTSSCNHAISGTVKLATHVPWSSSSSGGGGPKRDASHPVGGYSKQSSSDSSGNVGSEEAVEELDAKGLNDSGEDSGNNENWDRASSNSTSDEEVTAEPVDLLVVQDPEAAAAANVANVDADYQIYVYNTQGRNTSATKTQGNSATDATDPLKQYEPQLIAAAQVKPIEDSFEILFARAEALYAHGYVKEACQLSVKLAEQLLSNPPVLQLEPEPGTSQQQVATATVGPSTSTPTLASSGGSSPAAPTTATLISGRNHVKRAPRYRFNPALHQISLLASATLSKAAFLCQVLSEHEDSHLLAFHVGLFGLELVRPPASTKALEVKLANQEQELVNSLKRIPLCSRALAVLREKAEQLRDGRLTTRGEALLPLILASYIFDALVLSNSSSGGPNSAAYNLSTLHSSFLPNAIRLTTDERLGFEASVAAIGLKANVSEADHPLLCEGTRRQRGDLALTLLVHYKDDKERLNKIMDKLLDKEIHMINRKSSGGSFVLGDSSTARGAATPSASNVEANSSPSRIVTATFSSTSELTTETSTSSGSAGSTAAPVNNWDEEYKSWEAKFRRMNLNESGETASGGQEGHHQQQQAQTSGKAANSIPATSTTTATSSVDSSAPETTSSDNSPTVSRRNLFALAGSTKATASDSSSSGESSDSFSSSSSTEKQKVNRSLLMAAGSSAAHHHHHSHGHVGAEMTYGDHLSSRTPPKIVDLTNGQSRGNTFESFNPAYMAANGWNGGGSSSVSGAASSSNGALANNSPLSAATAAGPNYSSQRMSTNGVGLKMNGVAYSGANLNLKPMRYKVGYKGKRGHYPIHPNQPSEASAHFMFELANTVLEKAGGNNTSVLFTQPPSAQNCRAHRNLHMCAFQIGLYALGLHNAVSPNWLSRTYSSQVSWITSQAMEIGHQAIAFLVDTWEGHFIPNEVASLADRASRSQEPCMVLAAAQLALSCLPHAHALTPNEIQRALIQCKEQSNEMLERACLAVESAAQGGGVYPEVLFHVARKWHELYENEVRLTESSGGGAVGRRQGNNGANNNGHQANQQAAVQVPAQGLQQQHQANQQPLVEVPAEESMAVPGQAPANAEQQMPAEFMYFNEAAVYSGPPFEAYGEAGAAELANGAPIVLNSASGCATSQANAVQLYQGAPMYPATAVFHPAQGPFPGGVPFGAANMARFYPNTSTMSSFNAANMVAAAMQQSAAAAASARYFSPGPYGYGPVSGQQPMLPYSSYSTNFYQLPVHGKQQPQLAMAPTPFYYPQMAAAAVQNNSSMHRTGGYLLPQPGCTNQPMMYPIGGGSYGPYMNFPTGTFGLGGSAHPASLHGSVSAGSNSNSQSIHLSPRQLAYLHAVYRVGMLAMDTLARRVNDDRPQTKYARNPFYCEDVKWLLMVAKKLGTSYVQDFCLCSANAIGSPFVLYDIITEAAQSLGHGVTSANANSPYMQTIRSQLLTPLIHKCQQLFSACIYFQILHITTDEYDEFLSTIRSARLAFQLLQGGNLHFNELMQSLKRTKTCKKELWQSITNVMQQTT